MTRIAACTASGGRPEALSICRRYMARQTVEVEHIVSEDESLKIGPHLAKVLRMGLDVGADLFLVIEDDDWYPDWYAERIRSAYENGAQYIGSDRTRYYHLPTGGHRSMYHRGRSTGSSTGFGREGAELMVEILERDPDDAFPDLRMWEAARESFAPIHFYSEPIMVGIKGMPGRPGTTGGHKQSHYTAVDRDWQTLQEWIGFEDAGVYRSIRERMAIHETA